MGHAIFGSRNVMLKDAATLASHGGALDVAQRMYPKAPRPWLDLSTGINPVAYPIGALAPAVFTRLPDETELRALETLAGARYGAPSACSVVATPGAQALIQLLPALCGGRDVRVLGRTFSEFEHVFRDADRNVRIVPHSAALHGADVAIVVNPNNPDGRYLPATDVLNLVDRVGTLVVDEAFMDALPLSQSVVPRLSSRRMIVLRSFGKMYGLAGLRLGFALCFEDVAARLRSMLGPWPVNGPALAIACRALADEPWLANARARLVTDAARLMFYLRHIGVTLVGGTPLFCLVSHPAAPALFTALAEAGILTRPFAAEPSWLRFGFPGCEHGWGRLETALAAFRYR